MPRLCETVRLESLSLAAVAARVRRQIADRKPPEERWRRLQERQFYDQLMREKPRPR